MQRVVGTGMKKWRGVGIEDNQKFPPWGTHKEEAPTAIRNAMENANLPHVY